jgi:phosphate transport system substrate-binding protein
MRWNALFAGLVLGLAVAPLAAAEPPANVVQVKGSDTIGGILGQEIAKTYTRLHPGVEVRWEALGSGTAFVGLLDGSAQLGASSRSVKAAELAEAKRLGFELREYVLGYDGIAVVVHPANPVGELSIAQLSDLFTGKVRNWREVGGPDLPIHRLSRPSYSGTHAFFRDKVLRRGNDKGPEDFAPGTEILEENGAILKKVAADPGAVSYVGLGWLSPEVKTIGVAAVAGQRAIRASVETVRTGTYPIYRPLLLYSVGEPRGAARDLLSFMLSAEGQKLVARADFVPSDLPSPLAPAVPASYAPAASSAAGAARELVRLDFPRGGTALDRAARARLDAVATRLKAGGLKAEIVGHADATGSREANRVVALSRASAVVLYLTSVGVARTALHVESRGSDEPVATNDTAAGRHQNRRVDVTLVALR